MLDIDKLNEFTQTHGELRRGRGLVTGTIALSLGILCFLGVLAFHFPQYLTTPELRKSYNVDVMRFILLAAMVVSGGLALVNIIFNRSRWLSSAAFLLVAAAALQLAMAPREVVQFVEHVRLSLACAFVGARF